MMNILIIYDSAYGNTARIAEAMASAVPAQHRVTAKQVNQAGAADASDADILVEKIACERPCRKQTGVD